MESDNRESIWEILLQEAQALAERTRERLRDLQKRFHLPEQVLEDLEWADADRTDLNLALPPPAELAIARKPSTVGKELAVSPNTRGLQPMLEIYLKCLGRAFLDEIGSDWGITISRFPCTVGRHPECPARIDHPLISRRHCSFFVEKDQIWVEDLGSRNGIRLNGKWLRSPQPVRDGDRLELAALPFQIRLPVAPAMPIVQPKSVGQPAEAVRRLHRVLVVEDNADAAEALAMLLQTWGYNVRIAHNGPDAIRAATFDPPDTVLLDICLPGMDGYRVAEQFRAESALRKARMVAMTGYEPAEKERLNEKTFDRLLTKPVDPQALQEVLHKPQ
jgi:CheY-like chemotaxis protein